VISAEPGHALDRIAQIVKPCVRIDGRGELEGLLGRLLVASEAGGSVAPKTLDLIGHSTAAECQLRLGGWVIDAGSPTVRAFFRELADHDVLPRLGIEAVRLLACKSADTGKGRATICRLADILGVEIYGTSHLLYDAHYSDEGFRDTWKFLLIGARDLQTIAREPEVIPPAERWPRTLDIDALPAVVLAQRTTSWPTRVATVGAARELLQLVRRAAGAQMAGLLTTPMCELALPSTTAGAYHIAHVLLDGEFVRFYPDGEASPGVVYPVNDAYRLRRIVDGLAVTEVDPISR
jgi:hypothetical protein